MKRTRSGFTLVEISLFLAITAAIFVGVAIGTSNSIFQQRYNDAVQNYVEFLRTVYSQVSNVQSESNGRSEEAIYGKLVTFERGNNGDNKIKTYNVIGDLENSANSVSGNGVLDKLKELNANIIVEKDDGSYGSVGFVDSYVPRWSSQIQTIDGWNDGYELFTGMLLIVRSPSSGTVYTYATDDNVETDYDKYIDDLNGGVATLGGLLDLYSFTSKDVDFCINPNGSEKSNLRRDVRVVAKARNASGIEIISDDESRCEP